MKIEYIIYKIHERQNNVQFSVFSNEKNKISINTIKIAKNYKLLSKYYEYEKLEQTFLRKLTNKKLSKFEILLTGIIV